MPSQSDRFQVRSSPDVRWEAKPAPPSVLMSKFPEKVAVREEGEQVRVEVEEPPRTRSSEVVQSEGFQALLVIMSVDEIDCVLWG